MKRRAFITAGLAIWCALLSAPVRAQDRPTVFMHGFGAEASDWAPTADRLRGAVALQPHIPPLPWREEYGRQASELESRAEYRTLPPSTVVVGHSNGGVVAREWSRLHRINGIVTIGTPHRGAPIMQNLLAWSSFNSVAPVLINRVLNAFSVPSDWWWAIWFVEESLRWIADFSFWSVFNLFGTLGVREVMPVVWEMRPGSPFLNDLNSGWNLGREYAEVPNRVGIVSVAHNFFYAGPARAIAPDHADAIAAVMYSAALGLMAWGNLILANAPLEDVTTFLQAMSLLDLAGFILAIDPTYCEMVSSPDIGFCTPNDGLVPIDSQAYPGVPNLIIQGPAHTQEKQQSDDALYAALVTYMHLAPRSDSVPGPPPGPVPPNPGPDPDPNPAPDPPPDPTPDPPGDDPVTITTGYLLPDQWLRPEDAVSSPNGRVLLRYQIDGNFVVYDTAGGFWTALWDSNTDGTSADALSMQSDGNLVVYDPSGVPLWASGTEGHPGAYLAVQDDGNVVVYDVDGTALWFTWTFVQY